MISELAALNNTLHAVGHPGLFVSVYDDDVISFENMGRARFNEGMIGINKAQAIVTAVNRYFNYSWLYYQEKYVPTVIERNSVLRTTTTSMPNIMISCTDSNKFRVKMNNWIEELSLQYKNEPKEHKPYLWIDCGNSATTGQILFTNTFADDSPKLYSIEDHYGPLPIKEDPQPSCSSIEAIGKQDPFINSLIATYAVKMFWQLLKDGELNHQGIAMDIKNNITTNIQIQYRGRKH